MIFIFGFAFSLSLLLSLAVRRLSLGTGAVDLPDFRRKLNTVPVPRLGGVAFFLAFFLSLALNSLFGTGFSASDSAIVSACGVSLLFGVADDFFNLGAWAKLMLQIASALFALTMLPISAPLVPSLAFTVLMMNAYNFIDGLDGLCVGQSLCALLFTALIPLLFLNTGMGLTPILLFFSLLGFLPLNAHPASLYMGECGSATLGLALAMMTLSLPDELGLLAVAFSLIPLFDTLSAPIRRILRGRSPIAPDRGHLHHRLLSLGHSQITATSLLTLLSLALSLTALLIASRLSYII